VYELFSTGTKVLALYVGYVIFESDVIAIALFSFLGVVAYIWLIFWVILHSGKMVRKPHSLLQGQHDLPKAG